VIATIPTGAETGPITIVTPVAEVASDSTFLIIAPPPRIDRFAPITGPPGTVITIDGQFFSGGVDSVTLNHARMSFSVDSDKRIRATVPDNATSGWIQVSTPTGTAGTIDVFTIGAAIGVPQILSLSSDSARYHALLRVHGRNFAAGATLRFTGSYYV